MPRAAPRRELDRPSRSNRELCNGMIEAYRPGHVEELLELLDPEIEWATTEGWIEREVWRGRDEVRAGLEAFMAEWETFWHELDEFVDHGNRFALTTRMCGTHARTGIRTEMPTAGVCDVKDGRIVRIVGYSDPAAALEAV